MARYQKRSTVIDAHQADVDGNYGILGTMVSTDWILYLASGSIYTMDNTTFNNLYVATSETAVLVGTDWN